MPLLRRCCICGSERVYGKKSKNCRNFYSFPNPSRKEKASSKLFEKKLLEKRLAAWKNVVGSNYDKCNSLPGLISVCSDHFHSGKPANFCNSKDIDWIPSKNLDMLRAEVSGNCEDAKMQSQHSCSDEDSNNEGSNVGCFLFNSTSCEDVRNSLATSFELNTTSKEAFNFNQDECGSCHLNIDSAECDSIGARNILDPRLDEYSASTTIGENVTGCIINVKTRPMVTIANPELFLNPPFSENSSTAVQCELDDNVITIKQEILETEAPLDIGPNLNNFPNPTLTSECGTQVDFDTPLRLIQLDKSTQTQMSSFPKSRKKIKLETNSI